MAGGLCASSAAVLHLLEPAVVELFFLCRGLHGAFVLLLSAPTCSGPCAVVWNTCTRRFCCSVTPFLLSVLVQTRTKHVQRRPVAAREYLHREALSLLRALSCPSATPARDSFVHSQRGSDVFLTSPSLHYDCFRHTLCRGVLAARVSYPLRLLTWPSASRAWHRLSVTFEMLGLCCCPDVMSSRGPDFLSPFRCSAYVGVPTQCPPRAGSCPSRRRWRIHRGTRHSLSVTRDVITAAACS